ncbi:transcriptional regulator [Salmonella enterica]|uniref:helix-turn-helix domain-containing protein n=1 Tax=Salmonella enterica TaxID=28901 RepID=UPI0008FC3E85|nr:helix-turn-helix domain-containing protein [Salmonella enterica]EAN3292265.1 transcriptional regulator [Salmonella enterica subsp. enterica serovar Oranienburg]EAR0437022.1 transcriptional regulator [Salmonella enterica subsp. enterica serovar Poona]EBH8586981.1 transcriptional regulator [Salmonella enterica subsp. enterica serovar Pomona]EBP4103981.1 transcriptional regulator [Salmonella enterica subsp. enterica]EDZ8425541.1 transcriptional regulator [Salmonella enterica subsp. enterica se
MQLLRQDLTDLFIRWGCDWSKDAIYAALKNKGVELTDLERAQNLKPGTMRNAFYRVCPAYEQAIAQAIGVEPAVIWPSRYQPKSSQHIAA